VERTALRRGDSGGLSSRGRRESREIEKPRWAVVSKPDFGGGCLDPERKQKPPEF